MASAAIEATLDNRIRREYPNDKQIERTLEGKEENEEWARRWDCQEGIWRYDGKTYIPEGQLRLELLHTAHDDRLAGHAHGSRPGYIYLNPLASWSGFTLFTHHNLIHTLWLS